MVRGDEGRRRATRDDGIGKVEGDDMEGTAWTAGRQGLTFSREAASMGSKAACSSQSHSSRSARLSREEKGWMVGCLLKRLWDGWDAGGLAAAGSLDSSGMASSVFLSARRSRGMLAG
jgi:hypothetical protein